MSRSYKKSLAGVLHYGRENKKGKRRTHKELRAKVRALIHRLMGNPEEEHTIPDIRDVHMSPDKDVHQDDTREFYNPFLEEFPKKLMKK